MKFSERIKDKRTALGWTQEQMARALSISPRAYHYYEQGQREPHEMMREGLLSRLSKLTREAK